MLFEAGADGVQVVADSAIVGVPVFSQTTDHGSGEPELVQMPA